MVISSFVLYNHLTQWKLRMFLVVSWQLLGKSPWIGSGSYQQAQPQISSRVRVIALALHQDRVVNLTISLAKIGLSKSRKSMYVPTDLLEEY